MVMSEDTWTEVEPGEIRRREWEKDDSPFRIVSLTDKFFYIESALDDIAVETTLERAITTCRLLEETLVNRYKLYSKKD